MKTENTGQFFRNSFQLEKTIRNFLKLLHVRLVLLEV